MGQQQSGLDRASARASGVDLVLVRGLIGPADEDRVSIGVKLRQLLTEAKPSVPQKLYPCQPEITEANVDGEQESRRLGDTLFNW